MGYVVGHSKSNVSNTRRRGNVTIGVDANGYDKTSVSGLYAGVSPVAGKHNIVRTFEGGDPDFYSLSNAELLNFVNGLGERNLTTTTPSQTGWAGSYSLTDNDTRTFRLTTQQNNAATTSAWRTWYWDVSDYEGQTVAISADVEFVSETNCTFLSMTIGQGNTGQYTLHIAGSDAADRVTVNTKPTNSIRMEWSGSINATGIVGFTQWINNVTANGANAVIEVSNVQIEVNGHVTEYSNPDKIVTSVNQAKDYLSKRSDTFFFDEIPDDVPTDGLILELDASSLSSYPGTGSTWYDLSGNGNDTNCNTFNHNGRFFYSVGSSPGQLNFSTPHSTTLNNTFTVTSSGWTIEELVRIDDTTYPESSAGTVVSGKAYGSGDTGFDWQHGSMQLTQLNVDMSNKDTGGSNSRDAEVNLSIDSQFQTYGRWILRSIYWDRDNDTCGVYYNGIFQDSGSISGVSGYPLYDGGGISWGTLYGWHHDGARAAMRVYSKVLSETEVKQNHYGGNIVTDGLLFAIDSGNLTSYESGSLSAYPMVGSTTGSLINGINYTYSNGGVWDFDGTDEGIQFFTDFNLSSYSSLTYEGWIKGKGVTTLDRWFSGTNGTGNSSYHYPDLAVGPTGRLYYYFGSLGTSWANTGVDISTTDYNHIAFTFYSNGKTELFVNGSLVHTTTHSSGTFPSTSRYMIGNRYDRNGEALLGEIAIVRTYNRALTPDEVLQNYNAQKARFL